VAWGEWQAQNQKLENGNWKLVSLARNLSGGKGISWKKQGRFPKVAA